MKILDPPLLVTLLVTFKTNFSKEQTQFYDKGLYHKYPNRKLSNIYVFALFQLTWSPVTEQEFDDA